MKFHISVSQTSGIRLGVIRELQSSPQSLYETPLSVIVTKTGSPPHLSNDVFNQVLPANSIISVTASHFAKSSDTLRKFGKGVSAFASLSSHGVCVPLQDLSMQQKSGYNTKNTIAVWSKHGKTLFTPEIYMNLVETMKPDWFESLHDSDTPVLCTANRISKSGINSEKFMKECLELKKSSSILPDVPMFIPLLGGSSEEARSNWTLKIPQDICKGVSLVAIHQGGQEAEELDVAFVTKLAKSSLTNLRPELVRQANGAWNPMSVIGLMEAGYDVFDSSLPTIVTDRYCALCFMDKPKDYSSTPPAGECSSSGSEAEDETVRPKKKMKRSLSLSRQEDSIWIAKPYELSLREKNHNLHHWNLFFSSARSAIKENTWESFRKKIFESCQ